MELLKVGMLNIPEERWNDALSTFDKITVLKVFEEKDTPLLNTINIKYNKIEWFLKVLLNRTKINRFLNFFSAILLLILRLLFRRSLKGIAEKRYDEIHVSYNDFDESALIFCIIKPWLQKGTRITRAYKEMRNEYNFLEKLSFMYANRVVFNSEYTKKFIEEKYGLIFENKEVFLNLDEDYRSYNIIKNVKHDNKLSEKDNKIHAVILAGRVLSNPLDKRSGSRLYYIDLIKELISNGIIVHLQAKKIEDYNGKNPYVELANNNENFKIEHDIDFSKNSLNAYYLLSKYDVGILHAHHNTGSSYKFDRINIPNRYYEYEIAHVVPIDKKGINYIIDKKAEEKKAIVVDSFSELSFDLIKEIVWDTPSFKDYILSLYGKK